MAHIPKLVALMPLNGNTYVIRYESGTDSGQLKWNGLSVFDPFTKIELEPSKTNTNSYHLRFCHTNRYWAKSENDKSIVAVSKQPEEDTSKPSCTLFIPSIDVDNGLLKLTHVQTGSLVHVDSPTTLLSVGGGPGASLFYVDLDTLVMLPERVVFTGNNGMILSAYTHDNNNYLQFSSTNANDGFSSHEVIHCMDGQLRFKSEFYSKFWRRDTTTNWVFADDDDNFVDDTLFWPVKVDDSTIALRNEGNNKYAKRYTTNNLNHCLSALASDIDEASKLIVGELVVESEVRDVKYHLEDARVFDEQTYLASVVTATNELDVESTIRVKVGCEFSATSCYTNNYSLKLGTKTTIVASVPSIVQGKVEFPDQYNGALEWGSTTTEKKVAEATFTITLPPKSRAMANYVGTQGKCSVPFSYTRKDKKPDGEYVTSKHKDGIFYGTDYYGFHFEQPVVETLGTRISA